MAGTTIITSRDNPRFKRLRLLAGDAREIYRQGQTVIDGAHLVEAYLAANGRPQTLVVSDSGFDDAEIAGLLGRADAEVMKVPDSLFRQISAAASPTGLLAVIDIPKATDCPSTASCVVLDAVQDPGNVGAILRTALAAGISDIFLGPGCAGAWTPRVMRAAQGAHFGLRIREQFDLARLLAEFDGKSLATVARGGRPLYDLDLRGKIAWLFGNEGQGLSPNLAAMATQSVTIPLHAASESLNVAAAAAVCIFEEVRQKSIQGGSQR